MPATEPDSSPAAETHPDEQAPGLACLVLEIRTRLGPEATPEQVAAEVRASGTRMATDEEVRHVWDQRHLPVE